MKVLFVASGNYNNVSPFITDQANALKDKSVEVDFYLIKGTGIFGYLKNYKSLRRKIAQFKPEIVHAHYGLSGLLCGLQRKVPTVVTFHGSDINVPKVRFFSRIANKFSAASIFVSKDLAKIINQKHAIVIPCGVDLDVFYPMDKEMIRKKFNMLKNVKYILFSSSFNNKVKNYKLAEEAISILSKKNLEILELKGYSRNEVAELMNGVDLVLLTSHSEGSPQFIKEAMACNAPIVSVAVGDVPSIIKNTQGCFIAEDSAIEVSKAIVEALSFNNRTNGRQSIERFDNKTIAKQLVELYQATLSKTK